MPFLANEDDQKELNIKLGSLAQSIDDGTNKFGVGDVMLQILTKLDAALQEETTIHPSFAEVVTGEPQVERIAENPMQAALLLIRRVRHDCRQILEIFERLRESQTDTSFIRRRLRVLIMKLTPKESHSRRH